MDACARQCSQRGMSDAVKQARVLTCFRLRMRAQHDAASTLGRASIAILVPLLMLLFQAAISYVLEQQTTTASTPIAVEHARSPCSGSSCVPVLYAPAHPNVEKLMQRAAAYAGLRYGLDVMPLPGNSGPPPYDTSLVNATLSTSTLCVPGNCSATGVSPTCLPCALLRDNATWSAYIMARPGGVGVFAFFPGVYLSDWDASYILLYNDTRVTGSLAAGGSELSDAGITPAVAWKRAMDQALLEHAVEDALAPGVRVARFNLSVAQRGYPLPTPRASGFDAATTNGAQWYFLISAVWLVDALSRIVAEKERQRRLGLHLAGFSPLAYWLATFTDVAVTCYLACAVSLLISYAVHISIIENANPAVWFLGFAAYSACSASFMTMLATVIHSERAANVIGAALLVVGFLLQFALSPSYGSLIYTLYTWDSFGISLFSIIMNAYPPMHFSMLFADITALSGRNWDNTQQLVLNGPGFKWQDLYAVKSITIQGTPAILPSASATILIMFGEAIAFFLLTLLFDAMLAAPHTPGWSFSDCYHAVYARVVPVQRQISNTMLDRFLPRWDLSIQVVPEGRSESFEDDTVFSPRAVVLRVEGLRVTFPRPWSPWPFLRTLGGAVGVGALVTRCARSAGSRRASIVGRISSKSSVTSASPGISLTSAASAAARRNSGSHRRSSIGLGAAADSSARPREPSVITVASVRSDTSYVDRRTQTGDILAVNDVSFSLRRGDLCALLGHNGAGKSTAIKTILGLARVAAGAVEIFSENIKRRSTRTLTRLGVCMQSDEALWPDATPRQTMQLFSAVKGVANIDMEAEITRVLHAVQLSGAADRPIGSLSGGMKRRVSLAIAALGRPELVILDEPSAGLDPLTRQKCWRLIDRLRSHAAILLTTHDMEEADALASHLGVMHGGAMVAFGSTLHLKRMYARGYRIQLQFADGDMRTFQSAIRTMVSFVPTAMIIQRGQDTGVLLVPVSSLSLLPALLTWLETQQARATAAAAAELPAPPVTAVQSLSSGLGSDPAASPPPSMSPVPTSPDGALIRRFTLLPPSLAEVLSSSAHAPVPPPPSSIVTQSGNDASAAPAAPDVPHSGGKGRYRPSAGSTETRTAASSVASMAGDDDASEEQDMSVDTLMSTDSMPLPRGGNCCTRIAAAIMKDARTAARDTSSLACQVISPVLLCTLLWMFHFLVASQFGPTRKLQVPSYIFPLNAVAYWPVNGAPVRASEHVMHHLLSSPVSVAAPATNVTNSTTYYGNCVTVFSLVVPPRASPDVVATIGALPPVFSIANVSDPFPSPPATVSTNASGLLGMIDSSWCQLVHPSQVLLSAPAFVPMNASSQGDVDASLTSQLQAAATTPAPELDRGCNATDAGNATTQCVHAAVPDGVLIVHDVRYPNMSTGSSGPARDISFALRYDMQVDDSDFMSYHRRNNFTRLGLPNLPAMLSDFPATTLTVQQGRLSFMHMLWKAYALNTGLLYPINSSDPSHNPVFLPAVVAAGNQPGYLLVDLRQFVEIVAMVVLPIVLSLQLPAFALTSNSERCAGLTSLQFRAGLRPWEHLVSTLFVRVVLFAACNALFMLMCVIILRLGVFTLMHVPSILALIFLWGVWTSTLGTVLGLWLSQASTVSAVGFAVVIFSNLIASMFGAIIFGNTIPQVEYTELPTWMFMFPQLAFVRALFRLTYTCTVYYDCPDTLDAFWLNRDAAAAMTSLLIACAVTVFILAAQLHVLYARSQGVSLSEGLWECACCWRGRRAGTSVDTSASAGAASADSGDAPTQPGQDMSRPLLVDDLTEVATAAKHSRVTSGERVSPNEDSDDDDARPAIGAAPSGPIERPRVGVPSSQPSASAAQVALEEERWRAWCALAPSRGAARSKAALVLLDVTKRFPAGAAQTPVHATVWQRCMSAMAPPAAPAVSAAVATAATDSATGHARSAAVDTISLVLRRGEALAIIGGNGAGKSTLVSLIARTLAPSSGSIRINASRRHASEANQRTLVGYCSQANVLWENMNVGENVDYVSSLRGFANSATRLSERRRVLELVGLHRFASRRAGDLSGGMKRRLCLAMALVGSPPVLIADEAGAGLDPASRTRICEVLQRVKQVCAVITVTHDMDEVRMVADRVALMAGGKFQFLGTLEDLLHQCGIAATLRVTYSESHAASTRSFIQRAFPALMEWRHTSTSAMYMLSSAAAAASAGEGGTSMSAVAAFMATRGPEGGVSEWGIGACDANTAVATLLRASAMGRLSSPGLAIAARRDSAGVTSINTSARDAPPVWTGLDTPQNSPSTSRIIRKASSDADVAHLESVREEDGAQGSEQAPPLSAAESRFSLPMLRGFAALHSSPLLPARRASDSHSSAASAPLLHGEVPLVPLDSARSDGTASEAFRI